MHYRVYDLFVSILERHTVQYHLMMTDATHAVFPSHFDAIKFKDSPKHQTGAPNKKESSLKAIKVVLFFLLWIKA